MSTKTDEQFREFATWYHYEKQGKTRSGIPMERRMDFNEDAINNMALLITYIYEDLKKLESGVSPTIVLPRG